MKTLTRLTPAQIARFGEWSKKWIEIGLSTEPADFDQATAAALRAYALCNLNKPTIILRLGSPYAATTGGALAWHSLKANESQVRSQVWSQVESQVGSQVWSQVRSQVGSQFGSQVRSQVWSQVESQVWSQVGSQVRSQVRSQVESQVGSQVWSQVRSQVESQVWSQVGSQVRSQVWSQVRSQVESSISNYRGGAFWASWCAYITFLRDVMGLEDPTLKIFEIDETLAKSCGWVWWHENVLAISDRPLRILRDDQGRLHSPAGKAIEYRDGWGFSCWHGTVIPDEWLTPDFLTPKIVLTHSNIEQRRAACEIIGWARMLTELNARTIDAHASEYIGSLVEVDLPDSGPERFLRVRCGTGREFAIPVPREIQTAHQANAWSYGLDTYQLNPEVRT